MTKFNFDEWYVIVSIALFAGTVWHVREKRMREILWQKRRHDERIAREKERLAKLALLSTEVVRTRLIVDAWLLRHPNASLRHPGAKVVLITHMNALREYHEMEGCKHYLYPSETVRQYDNAYWRAVWHVYGHGNTRTLPKCPLES